MSMGEDVIEQGHTKFMLSCSHVCVYCLVGLGALDQCQRGVESGVQLCLASFGDFFIALLVHFLLRGDVMIH